jgi:hypothetical protein
MKSLSAIAKELGGLVCFFPEGTYVNSDTISCEKQVRKRDRHRNTDRLAQFRRIELDFVSIIE